MNMEPCVLSTGAMRGDPVVNRAGEDLGKIEEIMLDIYKGQVAYAVLSFGGFLGIGEKLFAIPWRAFTVDPENRRFILDVPKEKLEQAPGFDKNEWPNFADTAWGTTVHDFYGQHPYWSV